MLFNILCNCVCSRTSYELSMDENPCNWKQYVIISAILHAMQSFLQLIDFCHLFKF
jgi:hypothetical protein